MLRNWISSERSRLGLAINLASTSQPGANTAEKRRARKVAASVQPLVPGGAAWASGWAMREIRAVSAFSQPDEKSHQQEEEVMKLKPVAASASIWAWVAPNISAMS